MDEFDPKAIVPAGGGGARIPPPPPHGDDEDPEERGMLRMSFLEHLEELRSRLIKAILGLGVAFVLCIGFSMQLWDIVRQPAVAALLKIGINPPNLVITQPMENFMILWFKLPLVISLFVASPFVDVMLGVAVVFEMPVVIFFLTLLRIASPKWLLAHSRYAILAIVIIAAIVTPTPDVFNLMLFAIPMVLLYFVGVFASFLLVMHREGRRFPWTKVLLWTLLVLAILAGFAYFEIMHYHMHLLRHWPFLAK